MKPRSGVYTSAGGLLLYTTKAAAVVTGRSNDYITKLIREGYIDEPLYLDPPLCLVFTENQVKLLSDAFAEMTPRQRNIKDALAHVRDHWEDDYAGYPESEARSDIKRRYDRSYGHLRYSRPITRAKARTKRRGRPY